MALVCPVDHPLGEGTSFCRLCGRDLIEVADAPVLAAVPSGAAAAAGPVPVVPAPQLQLLAPPAQPAPPVAEQLGEHELPAPTPFPVPRHAVVEEPEPAAQAEPVLAQAPEPEVEVEAEPEKIGLVDAAKVRTAGAVGFLGGLVVGAGAVHFLL